jgi:hypothetical protein
MGGTVWSTARLTDGTAPAWDRFAHWPGFRARLGLLALILMLIASALVPGAANQSPAEIRPLVESRAAGHDAPKAQHDEDLALYDRVIKRIRNGENYYDFIVEEQRRSDYPVRPGVAVRLPTLAYIHAWLGEPGRIVAAIVLFCAVAFAWWRRLGDEPGGEQQARAMTLAFLFVGASLVLNPHYFVLHEIWAGMLLALAFGLHRPSTWGSAMAAAALAVAIRELALPFILLMGAMAFWRRDWKEGAAWTALAAVFLIGLTVHLSIVDAHTFASDRLSYPWLVIRGLSGWLSNIILSTPLHFMPSWVAGPLVILTMAGWAGWRSPAGTFGIFFYLGYGLAFMFAGRASNFYWATVMTPAMFIGLAFTPRALKSLLCAAFPAPQPQFALAK